MPRAVFIHMGGRRPLSGGSMGALLLRFAINATGLFLASVIVPGIEIGDWQALLAGTAIFAIVNMLVRPVALLLTFCLVIVTFGLFVIVVNTAMLGATAWVAGQLDLNFIVEDFWSALFGALIISAVSFIATFALNPPVVRGMR
jgi:putative membrane protein